MGTKVYFFEEFFECNNAEVGNRFLKAMNLPEDVEQTLKDYYVEHLEQKQMATKYGVEERTIKKYVNDIIINVPDGRYRLIDLYRKCQPFLISAINYVKG